MLQQENIEEIREQHEQYGQIHYPSDEKIKRFICLLNWVLDNPPNDNPQLLEFYKKNEPNAVGLYGQINGFFNDLSVKAQQGHPLAKKILQVVNNDPKNCKFSASDQKPQSLAAAQKDAKGFALETFSVVGGINPRDNLPNMGPWPEYDYLRNLAQNNLWNPPRPVNPRQIQQAPALPVSPAPIVLPSPTINRPNRPVQEPRLAANAAPPVLNNNANGNAGNNNLRGCVDNSYNPVLNNSVFVYQSRGVWAETVCFMFALAAECQVASGCGCLGAFLAYWQIYGSQVPGGNLGVIGITGAAGFAAFMIPCCFLAAVTSLIYARFHRALREAEVEDLERLHLNYKSSLPSYGSNTMPSLFAERQNASSSASSQSEVDQDDNVNENENDNDQELLLSPPPPPPPPPPSFGNQ